MTEQRFATPLAIVAAGALIGGGLYLGLRSAAEAPRPSPAAAPERDPPARMLPAPAPIAVVASDSVAVQATAGLEAQRAALLEKCWRSNGPPAQSVRYVFNFTFDAQGKQIARGVSEGRGNGNPEVTQCVLQTLTEVVVSPPGASVYVEVPFSLP